MTKTWRCRNRAHKGECHNRNIKEENLIKEICKALEWEKLEAELFGKMGDTVQVTKECVRVSVARCKLIAEQVQQEAEQLIQKYRTW